MTQEALHEQHKQISSGMVQLAYEFVGSNADEVDAVYVYVCFEGGEFFNCFYRINGQVSAIHKVNDHLGRQVDTAMPRMMGVLKMGCRDALEMRELLVAMQGKCPTEMKMVFHPKTGGFDLQSTYEPVRGPGDAASVPFMAWLEAVAAS